MSDHKRKIRAVPLIPPGVRVRVVFNPGVTTAPCRDDSDNSSTQDSTTPTDVIGCATAAAAPFVVCCSKQPSSSSSSSNADITDDGSLLLELGEEAELRLKVALRAHINKNPALTAYRAHITDATGTKLQQIANAFGLSETALHLSIEHPNRTIQIQLPSREPEFIGPLDRFCGAFVDNRVVADTELVTERENCKQKMSPDNTLSVYDDCLIQCFGCVTPFINGRCGCESGNYAHFGLPGHPPTHCGECRCPTDHRNSIPHACSKCPTMNCVSIVPTRTFTSMGAVMDDYRCASHLPLPSKSRSVQTFLYADGLVLTKPEAPVGPFFLDILINRPYLPYALIMEIDGREHLYEKAKVEDLNRAFAVQKLLGKPVAIIRISVAYSRQNSRNGRIVQRGLTYQTFECVSNICTIIEANKHLFKSSMVQVCFVRYPYSEAMSPFYAVHQTMLSDGTVKYYFSD
eukprot:GHVU01107094.1.p1 GENE.GHVU01107094.1~~GHVU01107094.1.p1  ORF type:complete len:460 (+),score=15.41 GHVU01107094.1:119-1498(+)